MMKRRIEAVKRDSFTGGVVNVVYSAARWRHLAFLRREAAGVLAALWGEGIRGVVVGSVARGDVHRGSDIDVFVEAGTPHYMVENALLEGGYTIEEVRIVKATPRSGLKITYHLGGGRNVILPVSLENAEEEEFPRYAGSIALGELERGERVCGVNKRLYFIEPVPEGHREWFIVGREAEAAARLGVSIGTVLSRVKHRLRRYRGGRRGLYVDITAPYGRHAVILGRLTG